MKAITANQRSVPLKYSLNLNSDSEQPLNTVSVGIEVFISSHRNRAIVKRANQCI